jgi:hypothetical protein
MLVILIPLPDTSLQTFHRELHPSQAYPEPRSNHSPIALSPKSTHALMANLQRNPRTRMHLCKWKANEGWQQQ